MKGPFFLWVDLSKKNGSRPELIYLLAIIVLRTYYIVVAMEESAFLVLPELRKSTVNKKHMQLHACEMQPYCCILICVTFNVVNRDKNCCQKQK